MKLGLSLGLYYDDGRMSHRSAAFVGSEREMLPAVISEPLSVVNVGDIEAQVVDQSALEFSGRFGVSFLTYNLNGLPAPAIQDQINIDLFA